MAARPTKKKPANAFAEINAAISQPACEMVFGDGIWDFRPKALYGIDVGFGETKLTDVDYRGNEGIIGVIPKAGKLFVFKILGADRVQELTSTRIGADPCNFVRVGASTQAANASASGTRAASASSSNASPAAAAPGVAPPAKVAAAGSAGAVVDGAAFRCRDGSLLHVTWCQGTSADATCTLTELHEAWNRHADRALSHRGACAGLLRPAAFAMGPTTSRSSCVDRTARVNPAGGTTREAEQIEPCCAGSCRPKQPC